MNVRKEVTRRVVTEIKNCIEIDIHLGDAAGDLYRELDKINGRRRVVEIDMSADGDRVLVVLGPPT